MPDNVIYAIKSAKVINLEEAKEAAEAVQKVIDAYEKELKLLHAKLEIFSALVKIHEEHKQGLKV